MAVRLIVERENEIAAFESKPYFRVVAWFTPEGSSATFRGELSGRLDSEAEAEALLKDCRATSFTVKSVAVKPLKKTPAPPFTTSTLQQEAAQSWWTAEPMPSSTAWARSRSRNWCAA